MAEKKKNYANTVKIVGYLKENNLEQVVNSKGNKVIRGSLIIATDNISSHKVQFYVSEKTFSGEESKDYSNLLELLPENTITIASYLKDNPDAGFDEASNAASKLWVMGRLDEYATRNGERVNSYITIKGFRAGFSKLDKAPFKTCAEFDIDIYINKLEPEMDAANQPTGRVLIEGLVPKYDKSVDKMDFVAVSDKNIAKYISGHYAVGDTVTLKGDVVNVQERKLVESEDDGEFFGRSSGPQYETTFVHERRIMGGSKNPLHETDDGAITSTFAKDGLAARELKMSKNGERAMQHAQNTPAPAPKATVASTPVTTNTMDDFDF